MPVAFALGLACLPPLPIEPRLSPFVLVLETFDACDSSILSAVPFFLLTANLMNVGGITDRLVRLAQTMVGHRPGGLAQVDVVLSILFAGISGSSTADAASTSNLSIPAQIRQGCGDGFSAAVTVGRGDGHLGGARRDHPAVIVRGGISTTSIGGPFLAGIVPGLLPGGFELATVHGLAILRAYPIDTRASRGEIARALLRSLPALTTPSIVIGGKIFGWFTATESACIAVLYATVLSVLVYREMRLEGVHRAVLDTGRLASVALFCVGTASAFG